MSASREAPQPTRLGILMEQRAAELGMNWSDLARASGVDRETLRKVRYGLMGKRGAAPRTKLALEQVFRWGRGSIDVISAGGDPDPLNVIPLTIPNATSDSPTPDTTQHEGANAPILRPDGHPHLDDAGEPITPARINEVLEHGARLASVDGYRRLLTDMAERYGLPLSGPEE